MLMDHKYQSCHKDITSRTLDSSGKLACEASVNKSLTILFSLGNVMSEFVILIF